MSYNIMKKLLTLILILVAALSMSAVTQLPDETLNYKVMFKWGLINKQAGSATLSIRNVGDNYHTRLTARSASWADKFYRVRDTLTGVIRRDGFLPLIYENVSHEGGDYKHDIVRYEYPGSMVKANCEHNRRKKKEKELKTQRKTMEAEGVAMDMLSMYYYMRSIDYPRMKTDQVTKLHIFSGKRKELLTIKYRGMQNIKIDGKEHRCYHISFTFTSGDGKKTSDDMDAWISADSRRIPMKLEGKLPVGKVHCLYTGK